MKNKKAIIIVTSIIGVYLVLAVILFGWDNFTNKFQSLYIMLDSGDKWVLKDGHFKDVEDDKEYNWKKFDVYVNNQLLGNYNLLYNNIWYLFDDNRNSKSYGGSLIAIRGNKKYEVIDFQEEDLNEEDLKKVKNVLKSENIEYTYNLSYKKKVTLDVDGDSKEETIYAISNVFTSEPNQKFSIVFIDNDGIEVLYKDVKKPSKMYEMCMPKVKFIIDIDKDLKYEIITECTYFSVMGSCDSLYKIKNNSYKKFKGC